MIFLQSLDLTSWIKFAKTSLNLKMKYSIVTIYPRLPKFNLRYKHVHCRKLYAKVYDSNYLLWKILLCSKLVKMKVTASTLFQIEESFQKLYLLFTIVFLWTWQRMTQVLRGTRTLQVLDSCPQVSSWITLLSRNQRSRTDQSLRRRTSLAATSRR